MSINLYNAPRSRSTERDYQILFSESNSRFLVEVPEESRGNFEKLAKGCAFSMVGMVRKDKEFYLHGLNGETIVSTSVSEMINAWKSTLGAEK